MTAHSGAGDLASRSILVNRVFDAPPSQVFRAWSDPKHLDRWFGPNGCVTTTHRMDFRPDGHWRFDMVTADGALYPNLIVYQVIDPPRRLVFEHSEPDGSGAFTVTVDFVDLGNQTDMRLHYVLASAEERNQKIAFGAIEAGNQTWTRLAQYLTVLDEQGQ